MIFEKIHGPVQMMEAHRLSFRKVNALQPAIITSELRPGRRTPVSDHGKDRAFQRHCPVFFSRRVFDDFSYPQALPKFLIEYQLLMILWGLKKCLCVSNSGQGKLKDRIVTTPASGGSVFLVHSSDEPCEKRFFIRQEI
jgi:hypothetical protein